MPFARQSYRPDPFRFRPPRIKRWLYWFFHQQNNFLLYIKFKFSKLRLSSQSLERLKQVGPGASTLFLVNHCSFMDPHVIFDLSFKGGFCVKWLAGIEPFDTANGIFGWFLQGAGAFSVDRGILDRASLQMAQAVLDEGQHPLVIYPEGEADYSNRMMQPFYPGAALFALNAAEKHKDSTQPVVVIPVGIRYKFVGSPQDALQKAIQLLHRQIEPAAQQENISETYSKAKHTSLWEAMVAVVDRGISYLELSWQGHDRLQQEGSLMQRIESLRDFILASLLQEHLPKEPQRALPYQDLMLLKNKLRSIVTRKRHAPSLKGLLAAIDQTDALLKAFEGDTFSQETLNTLKGLEKKWIGVANDTDSVEKRIRLLLRHLNQQKPYAELLSQANADDLARWERQMNDTRQVKMLTLLMGDLNRCDNSWEGIDELLVKLEVLLFSQFNYRGKKEVHVEVGEPLDVKRYVREFSHLDKKALQEQLTQHVRAEITALMGLDPATAYLEHVLPSLNARGGGLAIPRVFQ